jgi:hypothetical protein
MTTRGLRILWNVAIVAGMGVYIARFGKYPLQTTLFPRLVGYPVLVLALFSLGRELIALVGRHASEPRLNLPQLALAGAFGLAYLALWQLLGFALDTIWFLTVTPWILSRQTRQLPVYFGVGVATAALFSFLFHLGSGAILPRGIFNVGWI